MSVGSAEGGLSPLVHLSTLTHASELSFVLLLSTSYASNSKNTWSRTPRPWRQLVFRVCAKQHSGLIPKSVASGAGTPPWALGPHWSALLQQSFS